MPIQIKCDCGKMLRVKDESAGKKVRCPNCQAILTVPQPEPMLVEPDPEEPMAVAVTAAPPKKSPPARNKEADDDDSTAVAAGAPTNSPWSKDDDEDERDRKRSRRRREDDDDVDDDDDEDEQRRSRRKRRRDKGGKLRPLAGSTTSNATPNATIGGGILLMVGATVWCIGGLAFDVFFWYPPIMFIIGIVTVVQGAMKRE